MDWLIVGLGNPGTEYQKTRHNIGFLALDNLDYSPAWKSKFKGEFALCNRDSLKIGLLKPQTYMNLSGESVFPCFQFFKIPIDRILVVYDEVDLPFGTIQLKSGGGLAGHNGLKSIVDQLGTKDFQRLRLGIGRPQRESVSNYVLLRFF